MRVLWLRPAGKEHVSLRRERIARRLRPRGVSVDLLDATARNLLRSATAVHAGEYNVVVGNVRLGLYAGYPIARLAGVPFVADASDSFEAVYRNFPKVAPALDAYEHFVLRRADARVFVPEAYRYARAKLDGQGAAIAPNGVDFERFADPSTEVVESAASFLADHGVDVDDRIAVYVGSFSGSQSLAEIVAAAPLVDGWQFLLLGDGPQSGEISAAAADHENVHYPGAVEYDLVPGVLAHADAGLCLTRTERPLKVSEYGAAGLPTLGKRGHLDREFHDDEIRFVDPTPGAIADALQRFADDPELAASYADALRANAAGYSWDAVADTYLEIFEELA